MDHKLAEGLQAVEKYTMNEMSANERLQFEEHLFDCPICADEVRQNFTVLENLKEVLCEEKVQAHASTASSKSWRDWFRFATLAPSLAALALAGVVVVQNVGPPAAPDMQAQILAPAPVLAPVARGDAETIKVNRAQPLFPLSFTVDSKQPDAYSCEFADGSGKKILTLQSAQQSQASVNLQFLLPSRSFPAGHYQMVLRPASEPDSISTYPFVIADSQ